MKHSIQLLVILIVLTQSEEANASPRLPVTAGKSNQTMNVVATGENARQFTISVPAKFESCYATSSCGSNQFPLVIVLHGFGQTAAKALSWFESGTAGNVNYLTRKMAFFVAPKSLGTAWRQIDPVSPATDPASFADLYFINELVSLVTGAYQPAIDPNRIYIFGFSNGAGLAFHLLCFQHQPFRSFAMISQGIQWESPHCGAGADNSATATAVQQDLFQGFPEAQQYGVTNNAKPKPVLYMHGTSDANLSINDPGATVAQLQLLNDTVAIPAVITNYRDDPFNIAFTTLHEYFKQPGSRGRPLAYYETIYGDHSVSSLNPQGTTSCLAGTSQATGTCAHNTDYSAADEAWNFWNAAAGLNLP